MKRNTSDQRRPSLVRRSPRLTMTVFHGVSTTIAIPTMPCATTTTAPGAVPMPKASTPVAPASGSRISSAMLVLRPAITNQSASLCPRVSAPQDAGADTIDAMTDIAPVDDVPEDAESESSEPLSIQVGDKLGRNGAPQAELSRLDLGVPPDMDLGRDTTASSTKNRSGLCASGRAGSGGYAASSRGSSLGFPSGSRSVSAKRNTGHISRPLRKRYSTRAAVAASSTRTDP